MAEAQGAKHSMIAERQVTVHTIGSGGVEDLSNHIDDATLSWALLRCQAREGTSHDKIVAVACHGADMPAMEQKHMLSLSSHVLQYLGTADVTLCVKRGRQLPEQLSAALEFGVSGDDFIGRVAKEDSMSAGSCGLDVDQALSAVGNKLSPYNWVLLEPTKLELHNTGCGGLDELQECLPADKVMFGVLRFSFPRDNGAPPIVKYLFIHWIGPKVSVVRRGQWNSKLEEAALRIRKFCDFSFRKTAYLLDDLNLPHLIQELGRVTCVTCSDTRQFSADWYFEGLQVAKQGIADQPTISLVAADSLCNAESQSHLKPVLRESAEHAVKIVREKGRQWKWVLFTVAACGSPSSGGA